MSTGRNSAAAKAGTVGLVLIALVLIAAACTGGTNTEEQGQLPTAEPVRASGAAVAEGKVVPVQSAQLSLPSGGSSPRSR
jgi:hypothetical protein